MGLETRLFKAFFLKTSHTTPSENFRFCKVLRNNNFWRERERERERESERERARGLGTFVT